MLVVLVCGGISQAFFDFVGFWIGILSFMVTIIILVLVATDGKGPDLD
jgi:hypothetical protein